MKHTTRLYVMLCYGDESHFCEVFLNHLCIMFTKWLTEMSFIPLTQKNFVFYIILFIFLLISYKYAKFRANSASFLHFRTTEYLIRVTAMWHDVCCRSWCPDRTTSQARKYIADSMGPKYAEPVILDLRAMWEESDTRTPMICLLSMGSDPTAMIEDLAKKNGIGL